MCVFLLNFAPRISLRHSPGGRLIAVSLCAALLPGCGLMRPDRLKSADTVLPANESLAADAGAFPKSVLDKDATAVRADTRRTVGNMEFVQLDAGTFQMGAAASPAADAQTDSESPVHRVRLSRGFLLGRHEVTVGQFRRFVDATGYQTDVERTGTGANSLNLRTGGILQRQATTWRAPGFSQTDDHPVVCVSWGDAIAFCRWMSQETGRVCRLPTEAEWEYACRAGRQTRYATGDDPMSLRGFANFRDISFLSLLPEAMAVAPWDDGAARTAAVGSYRANAWGLHDMHGNVGEWCADWFDAHYYRTSPATDPAGPQTPAQWRAVRGGSWFNAAFSCRCSGRHDGIPTAPSTTNGFRVLVELPVTGR